MEDVKNDDGVVLSHRPPMNVRRRVWEIVEVARAGDTASRLFDASILGLIFLNVLAVVLQTVHSLEAAYGKTFATFEFLSVTVFTVEYVARLWACVEDSRFTRPLVGRLRFVLRPLPLVDLLAIAPVLLSIGAVDLRMVRAVRLFRLARVAKATRYVAALSLFRRVVRAKREELVLTTALMALLLVMASAVMYLAENEAQPDKFSSIPASMWWAVATLTTVGYGDVYPVTILGKIAAAFIAILGIGFFALPTAIIGSGFVEAVQARKGHAVVCSNCGHVMEPDAGP